MNYDAMLGDAHPDVHGERISDQIAALVGCRGEFLCHVLTDREQHEAARMVEDFVVTVSQVQGLWCSTLIVVWARNRYADGAGPNPDSPDSTYKLTVHDNEYREARDKFCHDYAAFLREFGL